MVTQMVETMAARLKRDLEQYEEAVHARFLRQRELVLNTVDHRETLDDLRQQCTVHEAEKEHVLLQLEHVQHDVQSWQVHLRLISLSSFMASNGHNCSK